MVVAVGVVVVVASRARPFTWPADIVTSVALVSLVVAVLVQRRAPRPPSWIERRPRVLGARAPHPDRWRWGIWALPVAAIAAWELFCYFGSPRAAHPTLSSMLDVLTATVWGRGAAFAAWLVLGWFVVTR